MQPEVIPHFFELSAFRIVALRALNINSAFGNCMGCAAVVCSNFLIDDPTYREKREHHFAERLFEITKRPDPSTHINSLNYVWT